MAGEGLVAEVPGDLKRKEMHVIYG